MSSKTIVELVDDLDGSEAHETVSFALDGTEYTIDLSKDNAAEFRGLLDAYRESARKSTGKRGSRWHRTGAKVPANKEQNQAVREWARGQGEKIGDRGRIPAELVARFQAAHEPVAAE